MNKRWVKHRGIVKPIVLLAFLGLLACPLATATAGWTITQLTDNTYNDTQCAISGSNVVWTASGSVTTDEEGHGYDYSYIHSNFGLEVENTNRNCLPAISGTNVVWDSYNGSQHVIQSNFGWNSGIVSGALAQTAISGTNVVWSIQGGGVESSFGTVATSNCHYSAIGISGTSVVWSDFDDNGIIQVYSNFAGQLSSSESDSCVDPDISGENVIWLEGSGVVNDNFGFSITDGASYVAVSGTNVVWSNNQSIYTNFGGLVFEYASNYSICDVDISGTTVVWSGFDGTDWEIYMATYDDGSSSTIPAPGAAVLASVGAGLVGWLRRRKTV